MKTRLVSVMIVMLILLAACTSQTGIAKDMRSRSMFPVPAGHYSLYYLPDFHAHSMGIPHHGAITAHGGIFNDVTPRFGRSLLYRISS